jgi:hypothetical protein
MAKITNYLARLTAMQRRRVARLAHTSVNHLTNVAHAHSGIGTDLAARLERATHTLAREDGTAPAPLCRKDLNATCARCPYSIKG